MAKRKATITIKVQVEYPEEFETLTNFRQHVKDGLFVDVRDVNLTLVKTPEVTVSTAPAKRKGK